MLVFINIIKISISFCNTYTAKGLIVKNGNIFSFVTNRTLVSLNYNTQLCMNPSVVETKVIVSDTGHDGLTNARGVKILEVIDLIKEKKDMLSLGIKVAENDIIRYVREVVPDIVLTASIIYSYYIT